MPFGVGKCLLFSERLSSLQEQPPAKGVSVSAEHMLLNLAESFFEIASVSVL